MINIDPLPLLPVSWKEFSDLLRASIPKTSDVNDTNRETHRISSVAEATNRLRKDRLTERTSSHPQTKEQHLEEEEKDPIRDAIRQLRNGMPRSPPASGISDDGIDILA